MDVKVYKKETVKQPSGAEDVYVPDVIDLIPEFEEINGVKMLTGCELVDSKDMLEQQCALATIFQKGLDPLDLNDGIRWSETILGEVSCLLLLQDIIDAVERVTTSIVVIFDIVEDGEGGYFLSYKLQEVT